MSKILGTNVSAPITPFDVNDTYPTHIDDYGFGGYRSVKTRALRDLIPLHRQKQGMLVLVYEEQAIYELVTTGWPLTELNWKLFYKQANAENKHLAVAYDIGGFCNGSPKAGETIFRFITPRDLYFKPMFPLSVAAAHTGVTEDVKFSIRLNGLEFGSLLFRRNPSSIKVIGEYLSTTEKYLVPRDVITIVAPQNSNVIKDIEYTLVATFTVVQSEEQFDILLI